MKKKLWLIIDRWDTRWSRTYRHEIAQRKQIKKKRIRKTQEQRAYSIE